MIACFKHTINKANTKKKQNTPHRNNVQTHEAMRLASKTESREKSIQYVNAITGSGRENTRSGLLTWLMIHSRL